MSAPAPCAEDLYERFASGQSLPARLPRDLGAALDALASDAVPVAAVGQDFCQQFLAIKRQEWSSFSPSVSDWELRRYANLFLFCNMKF